MHITNSSEEGFLEFNRTLITFYIKINMAINMELMPVKLIHLLNVSVQIANKVGN
jgi:hypothetical protein